MQLGLCVWGHCCFFLAFQWSITITDCVKSTVFSLGNETEMKNETPLDNRTFIIQVFTMNKWNDIGRLCLESGQNGMTESGKKEGRSSCGF